MESEEQCEWEVDAYQRPSKQAPNKTEVPSDWPPEAEEAWECESMHSTFSAIGTVKSRPPRTRCARG